MNEREIFLEAIECRDLTSRHNYVTTVCGDDESLLANVQELLAAHDRSSGILDRHLEGIAPIREHDGDTIGPYKLTRRVGEGGFGVVYLAEQEHPIRRVVVAVKVIKAGMDTRQVLARFAAERQALAMMDHVHIAKFLDAGTTESGYPFFAMEYVDGMAITQFCDEHRLPIHDRLHLFHQVCLAVQHAHQKGIIHRDLKPSNILVRWQDGTPSPKVIDFGIAKATEQPLTERTLLTRLHHFIGTPQYVSPEQATRDGTEIDTRSDIYSLGVILFELLTGTTPVEKTSLENAAIDEIVRLIRDIEAPALSNRLNLLQERSGEIARTRNTDEIRLRKVLSGELDWITSKSLSKEADRRYDSAAALADDIKRYLQRQPVLARPLSVNYRVRKFVQRNRGLVFALAIIATTLLIGSIVSTIGFYNASQAQLMAETELQRNQELMYVSDVNRAQNELDAGNTSLAIELLEHQIPTSDAERDLRSFPWYYLWRQCHQNKLVFDHGTPVHEIAYSLDGKQIISVGEIGSIVFWDTDTGRRIREAKSEIDTITGVAVIDEHTAVVGGGSPWKPDNCAEIEVWDLQSRSCRSRHLLNEFNIIHSLAPCPDQKHVAFGGKDGHFGIWNTESNEVVIAKKEPSLGHIWSLAFSSDGKNLITGTSRGSSNRFTDQPLFYWNWNDDELVRDTLLESESQEIRSIDVHPQKNMVAIADAGFNPSVTIIDVERQSTERFEFPSLRKIAFATERNAILLGRSNSLDVFDLTSRQTTTSLHGHSGGITAVKRAPNNPITFATSGHDQTIRIWDLERHKKPAWERTPGRVDTWAFSHDDRIVLSGAAGPGVEVFDVQSGERIALLEHPFSEGRSAEFADDDAKVAVAFADGGIMVWETKTWQSVCPPVKIDNRPLYIAFSEDLAYVEATTLSTIDHREKSWRLDLKTGKLSETSATPLGIRSTNAAPVPGFRKFRHYNGNRKDSTRMSANGQYLASGFGAVIEVWDRKKRTRLFTLEGHDGPTSVSFAPDNRHLISMSEDRSIRIWDLSTGEAIVELHGHTIPVQCSLTRDLRTLAVGFFDGKIVCYDLMTKQPILTLDGHTHTTQTVQFSHDGRTLATGAWSQERRIWRTK